MKPAIEIHNLSKRYPLKSERPYLSIRETIFSPFRFAKHEKTDSTFLALNDITFNIQPGERVGVIGKNGAGKSTLLKILSRITPPTSGTVVIRGKLTSLLEFGTGFHPELTGRENIFLNGALLGLNTGEINRKLEEIVEFSGVEKFLDVPLKSYSTGMQLRLAFSVVAHLDPDVMLLDEVLAVGDAGFQKKCIQRIEDLSRGTGRTIVLVSHDMNQINAVCDRTILLEAGKIVQDGPTAEVVAAYLSNAGNVLSHRIWSNESSPGNDIVRLTAVRMVNGQLQSQLSYRSSEKVGIEMDYEVLKAGHVLWLGHNVHNQHGANIFDVHSVQTEWYNKPHPEGRYRAVAWIPPHLLNTGTYYISTAVFNHLKHVIHLHEREAVRFDVYDPVEELTAKGLSPGDFPGAVRPMLEWQIDKI